jgi:phosphatidyl-myo-inositol dimannoside synthase
VKTPFTVLCLQHGSLFENYGGVEYYLHDVMTLLGEELGRDEVHCIVPLRKKDSKIGKTIYSTTAVRFSSFPWRQKIQNRMSLAYFKTAKKLVKETFPDIIVASHISLAPMAFLLSRLYKTPYAVIAYGIDVWGNSLPQDKWALRKADNILSISHWTKKILIERGCAEESISTLHPMLSPSFETESPKIHSKESPLKLLSISRLDAKEQYKGQDHALQALALLKKRVPQLAIHYTIQGDGTDKARLMALTKQLELETRVTFVPGVKGRNELANSYRNADVFVLPSWYGKNQGEGFGIVYVEAGAMGVPSIAYRCGGVLDIVDDGNTGWLVEPKNVERLAEAMQFCAENRQEVQRRGAEARKLVLEKFSKEAITSELTVVLNDWQNLTRLLRCARNDGGTVTPTHS